MSVCQMCGAALPDSATAGRKYCAACIKKRRSQQNHDAWERGREKREAIKATASHPCKRCGKQIYGNAHIRYCPECKKIHVAEARKRYKKAKSQEINLKECEICGYEFVRQSPKQRYCPD